MGREKGLPRKTRVCQLYVTGQPMDFPGGVVIKNLPANAGDTSSIPGSGRSPGVGNGNPHEYSCLENSMDRGAWWATVHGVAQSDTTAEDSQYHFYW